MGTKPIMPVGFEWVSLTAQLLILALVAKFTVRYLERAAREQGLHYI